MTLLLHPSERTRVAYALGDAPPARRPATAKHLLRCASCRNHVEAVARLQHALETTASDDVVSPPPGHVLDRILTVRAAGVRGIDAGASPVSRRGPSVRAFANAALLLVVAGSLIVALHERITPQAEGPVTRVTALLGPDVVFAQESEPGARRPTPFLPARVAALANDALTYRNTMRPANEARWRNTDPERVRLDVRGDALALVVTRPRDGRIAFSDSMTFDRRSLRMVRQVARRFGALWTDETFLTTTVRFTTPRVPAAPSQPLHTEEFPLPEALHGKAFLSSPGLALPLYFRVVALGPGAEVRVPRLDRGYSNQGILATEARTVVYRVAGSARVTVPAGSYDCWIVEGMAGEVAFGDRYWIDRASQVVVKRELSFRGEVFRRSELESVTR